MFWCFLEFVLYYVDIDMIVSHLVSRSIFELNNKRRLQATPSLSSQGKGKEAKDCLFYIRFGKCHKGDACKFTHDPSKVSPRVCCRSIIRCKIICISILLPVIQRKSRIDFLSYSISIFFDVSHL